MVYRATLDGGEVTALDRREGKTIRLAIDPVAGAFLSEQNLPNNSIEHGDLDLTQMTTLTGPDPWGWGSQILAIAFPPSVSTPSGLIGMDRSGQVWKQSGAGQWTAIDAGDFVRDIAQEPSGIHWSTHANRYNRWGGIHRGEERIRYASLEQLDIAADNTLWGVNLIGDIWSLPIDSLHNNFGTWSLKRRNWSRLAHQVAGGPNGTAWALLASSTLAKPIKFYDGQSWRRVDGSLEKIDVNAEGTVWGIDRYGRLFKRDGFQGRWTRVGGLIATDVVAGPGETAWALTPAECEGCANLWYYDGSTWTKLDENVPDLVELDYTALR